MTTIRRSLLLSTSIALFAAGCDDGGPNYVVSPQDLGAPVADLSSKGGLDGGGGLPAGSACTMDSECAGPGIPRCIDKIRPLEKIATNPGLQMLGVDFPGGYCSTEPSCHGDSDCGLGGTCFWPLEHVSADTIEQLGSTIQTDLTSFGQYGVCLKACTDSSDCRRGYVCDVPLRSLLSLVMGANISQSFCMGAAQCANCSTDATCQLVSGTPACACNTGFTGDGMTCTKSSACNPACGANAHCDANTQCVCDTGFSGDPVAGCQKTVDACSPNPCANKGTCAGDGAGGYTCTCAFGFTGTNCQTTVNACQAKPCQNGGTCIFTGPGTYSCSCQPGFTGTTCEMSNNACLPSNPCMNGGMCSSTGAGTYTCTCATGYSGMNCQTAINACQPTNPCMNGGACNVTGPGTYSCSCPAGWSGNNCQTKVSSCTPTNPCVHGTCTDKGNGTYSCACAGGWMGANCDMAISACTPTNPCMNNGLCVSTGPGTYSCMCATGYSGMNCETTVNACQPTNPCMNGGSCAATGPGTYSCTCAGGYTGNNCQTAVNACATNPCMNGGMCASTGPGTYACTCASGYSGTNCEIAGNSYCDVVYRLNTAAPSAASQFRVVVTGTGAQDVLNSVGNNASTVSGVTSPFTSSAFTRGFMRLRFPNNSGVPGPGAVQMIEYYMPLEFTAGITGATVTTNVDHSAGLLTLGTTGCPTMNYDYCLPSGNAQTLSRPCQPIGSGVLSGTTLTWDTCSLSPPAPPAANAGQTPNWTYDQSQVPAGSVAANPGCIKNVSSFGNVTCSGALCGFVPAGTLGVQNATWDQKLQNLVFSGTDYTTATVKLPESTLPDTSTTVFDSIRFASATPIMYVCGTTAQLSCNIQ